MMTLIDEYTRKCLDIRVARQLTSAVVLSVLSEAIEEEGAPSYIRSDNGSVPRSEATTCEAIHCSLSAAVVVRQKNIKAIYIDPGSPWQNCFIESFHNRLRDDG